MRDSSSLVKANSRFSVSSLLNFSEFLAWRQILSRKKAWNRCLSIHFKHFAENEQHNTRVAITLFIRLRIHTKVPPYSFAKSFPTTYINFVILNSTQWTTTSSLLFWPTSHWSYLFSCAFYLSKASKQHLKATPCRATNNTKRLLKNR